MFKQPSASKCWILRLLIDAILSMLLEEAKLGYGPCSNADAIAIQLQTYQQRALRSSRFQRIWFSDRYIWSSMIKERTFAGLSDQQKQTPQEGLKDWNLDTKNSCITNSQLSYLWVDSFLLSLDEQVLETSICKLTNSIVAWYICRNKTELLSFIDWRFSINNKITIQTILKQNLSPWITNC